MNILVTGAAGFIGKALVRRLAKENNRVSVLLRAKGKQGTFSEAEGVAYYADITDKEQLVALAPIPSAIDVVVHLAACIDYNAGKEALYKVNVEGTSNVFALALKLGAKKFVYVSSIEAIGPVTDKEMPAGEEQTCRPVNLYGKSKLEAEKVVLRAGAGRGMDLVILRLGNVYGPGSMSFVLPIANAVLADNKTWLYHNWDLHAWHPVYIDDAVSGIVNAVMAKECSGVYIIAGEEPAAIGRLASVVARELGVAPVVRETAGRGTSCPGLAVVWSVLRTRLKSAGRARVNWAYSIKKAGRELGYFPQLPLEAGVHRTIEWAKNEGILH